MIFIAALGGTMVGFGLGFGLALVFAAHANQYDWPRSVDRRVKERRRPPMRFVQTLDHAGNRIRFDRRIQERRS
jgi:hypothetical protein